MSVMASPQHMLYHPWYEALEECSLVVGVSERVRSELGWVWSQIVMGGNESMLYLGHHWSTADVSPERSL